MKYLLLFLLFKTSFALTIEGNLLERGTRGGLTDVNIYILPHKLKATTDSKGHFIFENVPEGEAIFVINLTGYEKLEKKEILKADQKNKKLYLEKISYTPFETTVVGRGDKNDLTKRTLNQKKFLGQPGSGGDPVKAVQNLPGVARTGAFSSRVIIQGAEPEDTKYTFEGHEVPLIFHFGGLSSIVFPEAIDHVDYLSAGYGAEYGRANGGLVGLWTRDPKKDRYHGIGYVDIFNSGLLLEGPVTEKSELLISGRYSYVSTVLSKVYKDNDQYNMTVAPTFIDSSALYKYHLTEKDDLRLSGIWSQDKLGFILKEPVDSDPAFRGNFSDKTTFYRLIPQWQHRFSDKTKSDFSVGFGAQRVYVNVGNDFLDTQAKVLSERGSLERQVLDSWKTTFGFDNEHAWSKTQFILPNFVNSGGVNNPASSGDERRGDLKAKHSLIGVYDQNEVKISRLVLLPQYRMDYFDATDEVLSEPRWGVKYLFTDFFNLRYAGGFYYQPPEPQYYAKDYGNPDIKSPRAIHHALGVERDFRDGGSRGLRVDIGGFYKKLDRLIVNSSNTVKRNGVPVAEVYNNDGTGKAYGLETQVQVYLEPFSLDLAYTLSRSTRTEPGQPTYPSSYDQTHNLNVNASLEWKKWIVASRFRYITGDPYTPIVGSYYDANNDAYVPKRGNYYSERSEPFYQLDLRIDRKFIYNTWIFSAYLDIQNITNHQSKENVVYSYDYSQKATVTGLPILPTFGLKGEF